MTGSLIALASCSCKAPSC